MKCAWLIAASLAAAPMAAKAATLVNGGFETGDLTGWTLIGAPETGVVDNYPHVTTYLPVEGAKLAFVGAHMFQTEADEGISQELDFNGRQRLNGSAAFLSFFDSPGFVVEGFVRLTDSSGHSVNLFHEQTPDVGIGTPWIGFSVTPSAGRYRLEAFTIDHTVDAQQSAVMLLDAFRMTAVPEPTTWATLILGAAAVGLALRRSRRAAPQAA